MKRDLPRLLFFSVLGIALIAFIFHNSMQNAVDSTEQSNAFLFPLMRLIPFADIVLVEVIVRKLAHFCEFAALGFDLFAVGIYVRRYAGKRAAWVLTAVGALIPCIDEFIQIFSPGRACMFRDMCIDWSGLAFGALVSFVLWRIIDRMSRRR